MRNFCFKCEIVDECQSATTASKFYLYVCAAGKQNIATNETCKFANEPDCNNKGEYAPSVCCCKKARENA